MDYQSVEDRELVDQQPTTDWCDEQWVLGHGLFANALVHGYRKVLGMDACAEALRIDANRADGRGFVTEGQPVYALWFLKVHRDKRCDVPGNSLAILTGMADHQRAREMVAWIESHCTAMRASGELALDARQLVKIMLRGPFLCRGRKPPQQTLLRELPVRPKDSCRPR